MSYCVTDHDPQHHGVIEDLLGLVRQLATDSLLEEIAAGDSQAMAGDRSKHLAALLDLRDIYGWSLKSQPENHWYPSEPIELISFAGDGHSMRAQVFCNALLLVAQLDGCDLADMHFRWFEKPGEGWYRGLPNQWSQILQSGFAILHSETPETEKDFWDRPGAVGSWIEPEDHADG